VAIFAAACRCFRIDLPEIASAFNAAHSPKVGRTDDKKFTCSSGTTELDALMMFVVDATKPFSVPAKFE